MTQWVEEPEGGRDRGPAGLVRAWVEVVVRPRRFFTNGVAPGDQAPGLVFAVAVTLAYATTWFALAPSARPVIADRPAVSLLFALVATGLVLAPLVLHLAAALTTLALMALVEERAGVGQTVQVVAYASAPCALAGPPVPALGLAMAAAGAGLLVVGLATVHRTSLPRAALAALLPGALVFGYGFGGFAAAEAVWIGVVRWAATAPVLPPAPAPAAALALAFLGAFR